MTQWTLDLVGNMESKSLSTAKATDTLTAALKAEERALTAANVAAQRAAVGSDPKKYAKAAASVKEASGRVTLLRAESARLANEDRIAKFYKGSAGAALISNASSKKVTAGLKEVREASKNDEKATVSATVAKVAQAVAVGIVAAGAAALVSKLYELGKAAVTVGAGFADEARSARLLNEAADIAGGTHKQLSGIIDDVNRRATIGKDRISQLGRELRIARYDSRQTQLTLDAMAVAESALGQGASSAIRGIGDQSRAMRRFTLGIRDAYGEYESLKASGLTKGEVFAELATSMHTSTAAVQREVGAGRVSVTRGMQAIDAALRKKFGANVAQQALGLDRTFGKLREDFVALFSGSNIEPLLKGLNSITSLFSRDTAEGKAFGEVVSRVMNELGKTAEALAPQIKEFIVGLASDAAKPGGLAETIRGWISDAKDLGATLKEVATAIKDIAGAAKTIGGGISKVTGLFSTKADAPELARVNKRLSIDAQLSQQGKVEGQALSAGIAAGIDAGAGQAVTTITGLAAKLKDAFRAEAEIHSPSAAFAREAYQLPAGAAVGVDRGTPRAVAAVSDMWTAMDNASSIEPPAAPSQSKGQGNNVYQTNHIYGIPGANEIVPTIYQVTKRAVDSGPRPGLV